MAVHRTSPTGSINSKDGFTLHSFNLQLCSLAFEMTESKEGPSKPLYEPLDSIRLLRFGSTNDTSNIDAYLESFALNSSSCPPYFALSYVWGPESHSNKIKINGNEVGILDSLYAFVRKVPTLPEFSSDTWWWIDSICINQKDAREKSSQIKIMGKIYKRAEKTVVWLGNEIDDTFSAESRVCTGAISALHRLERKRFEFTRDDGSLNREEFRQLRDPKWKIDWKLIERLLLRPWWRRVWTLQEFLICNKLALYCGKESISRLSLQVAIYALWAVGATDGLLMDVRAFYGGWNRRRIYQWHAKRKGEMGLIALLAYVGDCGATDERDRVYSLLGVARDSAMVGQTNPSDGVDKVYAKLVLSFIAKYNSLDIICFAHLFNAFAPRSQMGSALPSWVPDWRAQVGSKVIPVMASQGSKKSIGNFRPPSIIEATAVYSASGTHVPDFDISEDLRNLSCDGIILDTIDGIGGTKFNESEDQINDLEIGGTSLTQSDSTTNNTPARAMAQDFDLMETVSRCLVLDREDRYLGNNIPHDYFRADFIAFCKASSETPKIVHLLFLEWFQANKSLKIRGYTISESAELVQQPKAQEDFKTLADEKCFLSRFRDTIAEMARRLITTRAGYVGMAPFRARKGDIVCILYGCSIPVLLREREEGSYDFIGEVYLDGFMNGEGLNVESRRFRLV